MIRVGIYTGKVYCKDVDPGSIMECCLAFVDDKLPVDTALQMRLNHCRLSCICCYGCEEAKKGENKHERN